MKGRRITSHGLSGASIEFSLEELIALDRLSNDIFNIANKKAIEDGKNPDNVPEILLTKIIGKIVSSLINPDSKTINSMIDTEDMYGDKERADQIFNKDDA